MMELMPEYARSGYFPGLVEICRGESNKLLFLCIRDGKLTVEENADTEEGTVVPPEAKSLPKSIRQTIPEVSAVLEWVQKEDRSLYRDLQAYLGRFSYLNDEQLALAAHYVFLTYLHDHEEIAYCPYILFYAVAGRGKSRTGKALTYVCFRGYHTAEMREATVMRFADNLHCTIFFDLTDLSNKAGKYGCEDMLLSRFEKGLECARVLHPEKGRFNDTEYFETFGPTIIATNTKVDPILETRCLPIEMENRPGNFENPKPEYALELKARLTALRAKNLLIKLPEIESIEGISGRLYDITRPLFQVGRLINPEDGILLEAGILRIAGSKNTNSRETTEGRIVEIIHELSKEKGLCELLEWPLKTSEITDRFNENRPADRCVSPAWMGNKLTSLSLRKRQVNGRSEYIITHRDYKTLTAQYGIIHSEVYPQIVLSQVATSSDRPLPEKDLSIQDVTQQVGVSRGLRSEGNPENYELEERAAIMEYEGGLSREEAESKAALDPEIPF